MPDRRMDITNVWERRTWLDPRKMPFSQLCTRGYLPHLYKDFAWYFVTFRLSDAVIPSPPSLPAEAQPDEIAEHSEPPLTLGSCMLAKHDIAEMVQSAMLFFHNQRYDLLAWCIMPNHVHAVIGPRAPHDLSSILHSWKSFSSKEANRMLGRQGSLWQREYFDHLIRDLDHLDRFVQYTHNNPVVAGLCAKAEDWPFSSAAIWT